MRKRSRRSDSLKILDGGNSQYNQKLSLKINQYMMQPIKNSNECYWSTAVLLVSANTGFFMQICRKTCMSKTLSTKHPCNISLLHYHSHIASTLPNMAEATDSSYLFIKKYTCKSGYHCVPPIAGEIVITMQLRCQQNNKNKQ